MDLFVESIIGFGSIIGGVISITFIVFNLLRKKKIKKPLISTIIFLGLFTVSMTNTTKKLSAINNEVDNTNTEANIPQEDKLSNYKKDVKEPMDSYFDGYDALLGQWENTFNALADNQITSLDAYSSIKKLNGGFYDLWKMVDDFKAPDYFTNDDKENFKNAKTNLSMAVVQWQQATKKAMKMLDKNEFSNSVMSEIKELTNHKNTLYLQ